MENTDTQHLEKLKAYWEAHQAFPSMAKLRSVVGMASTASVFEMVGRLVESGHLQRIEGRIAPTHAFFARPVVAPGPSTVQAPAAMDVTSYVMPQPGKTFLFQVPGRQLEHENICQGDFLVMQQDLQATVADLVTLAQGHGGRFGRVEGCDGANLALWPCFDSIHANESAITVPGTAIEGVAVALIRRFDRPLPSVERKVER